MVVAVGEAADDKELGVPVVLCLFGLGGEKEPGLLPPPSKSQETPCLRQFPQVGWTSSHYYRVRTET